MLAAGLAGLAYARWTRDIADADAAVSAGQLEQALAAYNRAEAKFERFPATKQMFAAEYQRVIGSELSILYRLGRLDETIDRADRSPEGIGAHFWSGCAFFQKGIAEERPEPRLGWFSRAEDEFRRAVEAAPSDWDTKYDFELTTRLAAELRKQPKAPPRQLMQLLRPTPSAKPTKRVG